MIPCSRCQVEGWLQLAKGVLVQLLSLKLGDEMDVLLCRLGVGAIPFLE